MKINPLVRGAAEVQKAVAQLKATVAADGGADAARVAETAVLREMAEEARLVGQVDAHGPAAKKDLVALNGVDRILSNATTELVALSADERKKRMSQFVEPAAQWPSVISVPTEKLADHLQQLADATGLPQAALHDDFPIVARPGGTAQTALASWDRMRAALPGNAAQSRIQTLGWDAFVKRGELEVSVLEKTPPRPLAEIMASLKDANPRDWMREGLQTLVHPGEMKLFAEEVLRLAPEEVSAPFADKAREMALNGLRYGISFVRPGTQSAWNTVLDALTPAPPPA